VRLKVSRNAAEERLVILLTKGHVLRQWLIADYREQIAPGRFDKVVHIPRYRGALAEWMAAVQEELKAIFPSELEAMEFSSPHSHLADDYLGMVPEFASIYHQQLPLYLTRLKAIRDSELSRYTDLPVQERIHVEHVDSFAKVRDVNPSMVAGSMSDGYLDLPEDTIQLALEAILDVDIHKKDWGGEGNDLYTANVVVNGQRRPTAFLLKGNGLKNRVMEIKHCGKNGDQVIRLFQSPADLFVIQFVGNISESVIQHAHGEIARLKTQGKDAHLLIMNGQDTARLLLAYGKL